jgi:hypothetical protein
LHAVQCAFYTLHVRHKAVDERHGGRLWDCVLRSGGCRGAWDALSARLVLLPLS